MNYKRNFLAILSKYGDKKRDAIQTILEKELALLAEEFQLSIPQISTLEEDVIGVITGIKRSDSFTQSIDKRMGVSNEEKKMIVQAVDERIFKKIKSIILTRPQ